MQCQKTKQMESQKIFFVPVPEEEFFERIGQSVYTVFMRNQVLMTNAQQKNKWLNHEAAAEYLQKTPAALYKLSSARAVKFTKRGKQNYYRTEDLDAYMEAGLVKTADEITKEVKLSPRRNHFLTKHK